MRVYLRNVSSKDRSDRADRHLAYVLTFVAGAANAGGFMAVKQYTSHMSGIVSAMADNLSLGKTELFVAGLGSLLAFVLGAASSAILVNWGRRHRLHSQYALPLMVEALLLMIFGLCGRSIQFDFWFYAPVTVVLLCFIMGLQNAIVTKLSQSRIRTTHVTGLVTDFGIEIGKLLYWNSVTPNETLPRVTADKDKLLLLLNLILLFFGGGLLGALAFGYFGFIAALGLSLIVMALAAMPIWDDLITVMGRVRGVLRK
jgi:uncharacterized membrane protein YoaK (UPF0700 family)